MTVHQEASNLWLFESHNNAKRSQWLQSTLSELEEKTKEMLKLIEDDADTFAQRAEMYYKRRPELAKMIEDFYRSYRSLAEQHDLLKLESRNSFSNRGFLHKEWSFIDKSSVSSSVIFDSESEVEDPPEEDQVESKLTELPRKKDGSSLPRLKHEAAETFRASIKRERSHLPTYSTDSELSYPEPEETDVESKLEESPQRKSVICKVKKTIEKVDSIEVKARNAAVECLEQSESLYGESKEGQEIHAKEKMAEKPSQGDSKLTEGEDKHDSGNTKLMSEVARLKEEKMTFKSELDRKDEEKREVIRQLSLSMNILKGENDNMKRLIRDSKNRRVNLFEFRKLKDVLSKNLFGSQSKYTTTLHSENCRRLQDRYRL